MSLKNKVKGLLHSMFMMAKEEKIQPIIVHTDSNKLLHGKVALVTGESIGIGLAIAKKFQNSGAKVIIAGSNPKHLENAMSQLCVGE